MTGSPIIVPIRLDALVINEPVQKRDGNLRWWQFNYQALGEFEHAEPEAGDADAGTSQPGIYLHWSLPRALREGSRGPQQDAGIEYPRVPNRWLVVRVQGSSARTATAWVVESDCPFSEAIQTKFNLDVGQSSQYLVSPEVITAWQNSPDPLRHGIQNIATNPATALDPSGTGPQVANIGVGFPQGDWSERDPNVTFLTAMAPGNDAFSTYYAHNVGVFSLYDDLAGVDQDSLSYLVVGWYSNPSDDILASGKDDAQALSAILAQLEWTLADDVVATGQSLYQGMTLGIDWQRNGADAPSPDPLETIRTTPNVNVSIANSTIDAFMTLVQAQLQAKDHPTQTLALLWAFAYNLLPVINEINGPTILAEEIHEAWFGSEPGGYGWAIVDKDSDGRAAVDLSPTEASWLAQLNTDQAALNQALGELFRLQWDLTATWYKLNLYPSFFPQPPTGAPDQQAVEDALDPSNPKGISAAVLSQFAAVNPLLAKVPRPVWDGGNSPQDAWIAGVEAFATSQGLDLSKRTLKAIPKDRYYEAGDPVVMISGVEPAHDTDPDKALRVRSTTTLITGFTVAGHGVDATALGSAIPALANVGSLPATVPALIGEFFLLDPSNAAVITSTLALGDEAAVQAVMSAHDSAAYQGELPLFGLEPWTQGWSPLYMEWKLSYRYIPYAPTQAGQAPWTFDGNDYRYTPASSPATEVREIGGISKLSPSAQFVFKSRLDDYLRQYPNTDLAQLEAWIQQIDDWKFLGQQLTGFHDLLAMHDSRAFRRPVATDTLGDAPAYSLADLAGFPTDNTPGATTLPGNDQGQVGSLPYLPNGTTPTFHGLRSGQAFFEYLRLYDKFGRVLWLIEPGSDTGLFDAKNFPLLRDPSLQVANAQRLPEYSSINAVIALPPRVLQHARLDFDLVDAGDESKVYGQDAQANPIGGWVLPNHLDHALLLYTGAGEALGEFALFVQVDGSKLGSWTPPANSTITTLSDVAAAAPLVHAMITAPELASQAGFDAFLGVIDSTLWTVDPLGSRDDQNLSVLIGRPLALVRSRLQLRLQGPALRASDWPNTTLDFTNIPDPELINFEFALRLGDQATRHDGVIGYFTGSDYSTFNSVVAPDPALAQSYVTPIGPLGSTDAPNFIHLTFAADSQELVSILVDPRASMHAITGLLPIKQVEVPAGLIEDALAQLAVSFAMGPILTNIKATPTQAGVVATEPTAITLPSPVEQGGTWTWYERAPTGTGWDGYDLIRANASAVLEDLPMTLREGVLQLSIDLRGDLGDGGGKPENLSFSAVMGEAPLELGQDLMASPLILDYRISTFPSQLQISTAQTSTQGRVDINVSSSGAQKFCSQMRIAIPVGADAASFSVGTPSAAISTSNWSVTTTELRPGTDFGLDASTNYATFTFDARDPSVYELNYNLVFSFTAAINQAAGPFDIIVQETSGTSASSLSPKQGSFTLEKLTPFFFLQNFVATTPSTPLVPALEFTKDSSIQLAWESNGSWFQLFAKGSTTPIYAGTQTSFTVTGGAATDTTYFLQASMTSDPSGDVGGFEPIYLFDALTITITNPDLTPNSVAIAQTLQVAGATTLSGATTLAGSASVTGPLGVSGDATLATTSLGDTTAATLTVNGDFSAAVNATLGPITNDGGTFSNFFQTASGTNAVLILTNTVPFAAPQNNAASGIVINVATAQDPAIRTNGVIVSQAGAAMMTELATRQGARTVTSPLVLGAELHLSGHGTLRGGKAKVTFADAADMIVSTAPYVAIVTPTGACKGMFVSHKQAEGFEVQELAGGNSDAGFDWIVIAPKRHALDKDVPHPLMPASDPKLRWIRAVSRSPTGAIVRVHDPGAAWSPRAVADVIDDIESGRHVYQTTPGAGAVHVIKSGATKYLRSGADNNPDNNLDRLPEA